MSSASYQTVVQSQGAALADPQRRECRAYSGTGRSMRAQSGMHSGRGGLKLQEGGVRRGLSVRLGQQAREDPLPWCVRGRVVPCRHPSAAAE